MTNPVPNLLADSRATRIFAGDTDAILLPSYGMIGVSLKKNGIEALRRIDNLIVAAAGNRFGQESVGRRVRSRRCQQHVDADHGRPCTAKRTGGSRQRRPVPGPQYGFGGVRCRIAHQNQDDLLRGRDAAPPVEVKIVEKMFGSLQEAGKIGKSDGDGDNRSITIYPS